MRLTHPDAEVWAAPFESSTLVRVSGNAASARVRRGLTVGLLLALASCATPPPPVVSHDIDFKLEIDRRQGDWLVVAPYGRVWHPKETVVGADFMPYLTGGGWVHTNRGWEFESMYLWGKYTFHYGRWFVADDLGWLWWPDQQEAANWVTWRLGDGYVGWSPLPVPDLRSPHTLKPAWVYTKVKYLSARNAEKFVMTREEAEQIESHTQPIAASGPDPKHVATQGGLDRDPELPTEVPAVLEAPPPPEEVKEEPPPPPKKTKKKKKHRRR